MSRRPVKMELREIVETLVGPVMPVGETNTDAKRLENLKDLTLLVDQLLYRIDCVAAHCERPEASIKNSAIYAKNFLKDVRENI